MATQKYMRLKQDGTGKLEQGETVDAFVGAGDAGKIPSLNAGGFVEPGLLNAKDSSAGGADAGVVAKLDGTGRLNPNMLPVGLAIETKDLTASEALAAGDFTETWDDTGTLKVRKADASNNRPCDSFVLSSAILGATVKVYFEGNNTSLSSRTLGKKQWLSATVAGKSVETAPTTAGQILQPLGKALSATESTFEPGEPIYL